MAQRIRKGAGSSLHRIDLACEQTSFGVPPVDVHLKCLPPPLPRGDWTLLAYAAAGTGARLVPWLERLPEVAEIRTAPGLAPKLLRATLKELPASWASMASLVTVHHLDLAADGHCSWYIEATKDRILRLLRELERTAAGPLAATEVRCRPVEASRDALMSKRQFDTLAAAIALGYYDIPHRIDLRQLARHTGVTLAAVAELLRRAEAAVLTHYVDARLLAWPTTQGAVNPFLPMRQLMSPPLEAEPEAPAPDRPRVPKGA